MKLFRGRQVQTGVKRKRGATYQRSNHLVPGECAPAPKTVAIEPSSPIADRTPESAPFRAAKKISNQGLLRNERLLNALDRTLNAQCRAKVWRNGAEAALEKSLGEWMGYWRASGTLPVLMATTVPFYATLITDTAQIQQQDASIDECINWPMHGLELFIELTKQWLNQADALVRLPIHHPLNTRLSRASSRYTSPCILQREHASLADWLRLWQHIGVFDFFISAAEGDALPLVPVISHREIWRTRTLAFLSGTAALLPPHAYGMTPVNAPTPLYVRTRSFRSIETLMPAGEIYLGRSGHHYYCVKHSPQLRVSPTARGLVRGYGLAVHRLASWEPVARHNNLALTGRTPGSKISRCENYQGVLSDALPGTRYVRHGDYISIRTRVTSADLKLTTIMQKARHSLGIDDTRSAVYPLHHPGKHSSAGFFRSAKFPVPALPCSAEETHSELVVDATVLADEPCAGPNHHIPLNALLLEIVAALAPDGSGESYASLVVLQAERKTLRIFKRLLAAFGNANVRKQDIERFIKNVLLEILCGASNYMAYRHLLVLRSSGHYSIDTLPIWLRSCDQGSELQTPTVIIGPSLSDLVKTSPNITRWIARFSGLDADSLQTFLHDALAEIRDASRSIQNVYADQYLKISHCEKNPTQQHQHQALIQAPTNRGGLHEDRQ